MGAESWHPEQRGEFAADGSYTLRLPYADHRELLMDIMKYGADCEVLKPASLRKAVRTGLLKTLELYRKGG